MLLDTRSLMINHALSIFHGMLCEPVPCNLHDMKYRSKSICTPLRLFAMIYHSFHLSTYDLILSLPMYICWRFWHETKELNIHWIEMHRHNKYFIFITHAMQNASRGIHFKYFVIRHSCKTVGNNSNTMEKARFSFTFWFVPSPWWRERRTEHKLSIICRMNK